jgi:hypothetical protein
MAQWIGDFIVPRRETGRTRDGTWTDRACIDLISSAPKGANYRESCALITVGNEHALSHWRCPAITRLAQYRLRSAVSGNRLASMIAVERGERILSSRNPS